MKNFIDIISKCKILHLDTDKLSDAMSLLLYSNYDIVSFNDTINLNPGDTLLLTRDYITNIIDNDIYYVVNDIEYKLEENILLLTFLSILNPIILRNKSNNIKHVKCKRYIINQNSINIINIEKIIYCNNIVYYDGIANNNIN
jgi:hypothetical protein